jgi:hypothetical protein
VRYRLMASYRGSPFEAGIGPADGDIVLFAACPPPEELGFEPATGHWRKQLRFTDVQGVWESRPVGTFRGERCMVLDDLGDRLHIGYLGHDGYKAEQLGYWQVDRGVFELVAPRTEVTNILEERTAYPRPIPGPPPVTAPMPAITARPVSSASPASSPRPVGPPVVTGPIGVASPIGPAQPEVMSYPGPERRDSASYAIPPERAGYQPPAEYRPPGEYQPLTAYRPEPDASTGVALPAAAAAPLPLEAEALRAASAARQPQQAAHRGASPALPATGAAAQGPPASPAGPPTPVGLTPAAPLAPTDLTPAAAPLGHLTPAAAPSAPPDLTPAAAPPDAASAATAVPPVPAAQAQQAPARQRRAARRRMATERLFADLATLAGIPADSYAVGEAVEGALCLVQTERGFEVFHSADGARHELQSFATEESACFYLFGVLAAEAVRNGSLTRVQASLATGATGQSQTA